MVLDAENHEPTAVEMDAALVFTADGYSDADGVDHVTKPRDEAEVYADPAVIDDLMARAEQTLAAASTLVDWMGKLGERNTLVDDLNIRAAESADVDFSDPEAAARIDALEAEIDAASSDDPKALAAKMGLMAALGREGFDITSEAEEMLKTGAAMILELDAFTDTRELRVYRRASARRARCVERAKAALPVAVRAASSALEAALTTRLFGRIIDAVTYGDQHALAEATDRAGLSGLEEQWHAALREMEEIGQEIILLPPDTAADAHRRIQLYRQALDLADGPPVEQGDDGLNDEDARVIGSAATAMLKALAEREQAADRSAFQAAIDRLDAEVKGRDPQADLDDSYWQALDALWLTHSPDLPALVHKMRLHLGSTIYDRIGDDVDDPVQFARFAATPDSTVREALILYQDALRLAGLRPEIVAVKIEVS